MMSLKKSNEPNKRTGRKHTAETKALISERRRARTTQPRNVSQTKKRTSFYQELLNDYSNNPEAVKWIEQNKADLGHVENLNSREQLLEIYNKHGILTEYLEMYPKVYEEKCGDILFSDERTPVNNKSNDPWEMADNIDEYNSIFGEPFDD